MQAKLSEKLYRFREPETGRVCIARKVIDPLSIFVTVKLVTTYALYLDRFMGLIWLPEDVEVVEHPYRSD